MYRIRLEQFEGPLDLLLFFIRRDELDIQDIPIADIADEFLEYVRLMEQIDLDGVGDFLYMAALLISIKARMLLPSQGVDDEGEPIDPRQELVERLLEYVRFKEAADILSEEYDRRQEQFTRGLPVDASEVSAPEPLVEATVFDLIGALRRVLTEAPEEPVHAVEAEQFSVEEQQGYLGHALQGKGKTSFVQLMTGKTKPFIITTFLAVLEMARIGRIEIYVESRADDFYLALGEDVNSEPTGPQGEELNP